jgi:hypothetical protein
MVASCPARHAYQTLRSWREELRIVLVVSTTVCPLLFSVPVQLKTRHDRVYRDKPVHVANEGSLDGL